MLATIELYSDATAGTVEIQDVWPARMLTPKLETGEAPRPKLTPERSLGVGARATKSAAASEQEIHAAVFGATVSGLCLPLTLTLSPLSRGEGIRGALRSL
jgi:hypothetical protein